MVCKCSTHLSHSISDVSRCAAHLSPSSNVTSVQHGLTAAVMSSWEAHLFHSTNDCFPLRKGRSLCSQSTKSRASYSLSCRDCRGGGEIPPCNPAVHPPAIQGWRISHSHPPHHLTAQSTCCKSSCFGEKGSPLYTWSFCLSSSL